MRTALASILAAMILLPLSARADPTSCPEGFVLTDFTHADGRTERVCAIPVRGEVQHPYPFNVAGRSPLGYTYADAPRSFTRDVLIPLRRSPF